MQDRVLHRDLKPVALSSLPPLVQRPQNRDHHHHAGAGVADRDTGPGRRAVRVPGHAERAATGLRDHVEGEVFFERTAFAETLDLGVDDAGVDRLHHIIGQTQPLDRARGEVLDHDIRLTDHVLDQVEALRRLQVDGNRLLVGVEDMEIIRVVIRFVRLQPAAGIAPVRVLDLHHFGAEPGKRFGAGGAGLELGEIDNLDSLQKSEVGQVIGHGGVSFRLA